MKSKPTPKAVPAPDASQVDERFPRPRPKPTGGKEVIFLRVAASEKEAIESTANAVDLSVTDYLLRCHEVVAEKLAERKK